MSALKSNLCEVFYDGTKAGFLQRSELGYSFWYDKTYSESASSLPISNSLPLSTHQHDSSKLHPFFEGLCAQGWYRQAQKTMDNLPKDDSFTTLAINGLDLIGAVEIVGADIDIPTKPKMELNREVKPYSLNAGVCLICLKPHSQDYHKKCLQNFFGISEEPKIQLISDDFNVRAYSAVHRSSISGFQVKISVDIEEGQLTAKNVGGRYILKPAIKNMPTSCVNEHLSMKISEEILRTGTVAQCALIKLNDGELAYVTKRFDRAQSKMHMEDFSQLLSLEQFSGNYEDVAHKIKDCTSGSVGPLVDFLHTLLVQFYLGNSDYHLKNISLLDIERSGMYKGLSPLYDSLSEQALLLDAAGIKSEMALEFFNDDFETNTYLVDGHSSFTTFKEIYSRCNINEKVLKRHIQSIESKHKKILEMVNSSLLPEKDTQDYLYVLNDRLNKLLKNT